MLRFFRKSGVERSGRRMGDWVAPLHVLDLSEKCPEMLTL